MGSQTRRWVLASLLVLEACGGAPGAVGDWRYRWDPSPNAPIVLMEDQPGMTPFTIRYTLWGDGDLQADLFDTYRPSSPLRPPKHVQLPPDRIQVLLDTLVSGGVATTGSDEFSRRVAAIPSPSVSSESSSTTVAIRSDSL